MSKKHRIFNDRSSLSLSHPILFVFLVIGFTISMADMAYGVPAPLPTATPIPNVGCIPAAALQTKGCWNDVFHSGPITHATVLPNGHLLNWSSFPPHGYARIWQCNPVEGVDNQTILCSLTPGNQQAWEDNMMNIFCSGHSLMPDGTVMISGGVKQNAGSEFAEERTLKFTYPIGGQPTWQAGPDMYEGRWYPTTIALGDGRILTASGTYWDQNQTPGHETVVNNIPEILTAGAWEKLTGAGDISLPLYPWLYHTSHGLVFYAGPTRQSYWLNVNAPGDWLPGPSASPTPTPPPGVPTTPPERTTPYRESGSSVMYDVDKVMISGGGAVAPVASNDVIDLSGTSPSWSTAASMAIARKHHNLTIMADGKILATGGTKGVGFNNNCERQVVYEAEMWTPFPTNTWTTMAKMAYNRRYHSTAVLLRDGRVMVGGSDLYPSAPAQCNPPLPFVYMTQIFTPPYLFTNTGDLAKRPKVSTIQGNAPYTGITTAGYGAQITVVMNNSPTMTISQVNLIRLSSVTHSFNMNQRIIKNLTKTQNGQTLTITTPANASGAPPGHYLMFIINDLGVPSVAEVVQLTL